MFKMHHLSRLRQRAALDIKVKSNWSWPKCMNSFVPRYTAVTKNEVLKLQFFIDKHHKVTVLTGAGVSTESGQPDYRSQDVGLYARTSHKPVQFRNFMTNAQVRKRYWLRNYAGWKAFSSLKPNTNHYILAEWERLGKISSLITQNVDRLHTKAGTEKVIELHGTTHQVKCMRCSYLSPREELQKNFISLNPQIQVEAIQLRPDSDVEVSLADIDRFIVPSCPQCGGILKPDVIFFGESVPTDTVKLIYKKVEEGDALLVLGSSLEVYSGYRFVLHAVEHKKPVAIVNIGMTRADHLAFIKIDSKCSEVLQRIKLQTFPPHCSNVHLIS